MERWKTISWAPRYKVSDQGRIMGLSGLMTPNVHKGYLYVGLYVEPGVRVRRPVHVIVLEEFVGPRPDGFDACHNNGIRGENALGNLRWDTREANTLDRDMHGTTARGERNGGGGKLTNEDVRRIRSEYAFRQKGRGMPDLGRKYGVSAATVGMIVRHEIWTHVQ